MARPTPKNPLGKQKKPKRDNPNTIRKLEEARGMGLNRGEASLYADISVRTYDELLKNDEKLTERKDRILNNLQMRSKMILSKYMSGQNKLRLGDKEVDISDNMIKANQRRLERKSRDEFSWKTETEVSGPDGGPVQIFIPDNQR